MENIGSVAEILKNKGNAVWSIDPDASVFESLKVMAEKNVGALLVMKDGRLVGLISERDYARKIALLGKHSSETPVRDIITDRVITVTADTSIHECLRLMSGKRIRHLPVVQGEEVIGLISVGDLVNWIIKAQSATIDQLQSYISGQYAA